MRESHQDGLLFCQLVILVGAIAAFLHEWLESHPRSLFLCLALLMGLAIAYKLLNKHQTTKSQEELLKEQGIALLEQEQYQQAQAHYQQALTHYPEDGSLRLNYGLALAFQGQFEAAIAEYDQVLAKSPADHNALHFKADALLELKQYDAALAFFDCVLVQTPHDSHFLHDRGFVLQQLGRDQDSIFCYEQATHHEPLNDSHWGALVEVQQKLGQLYASDKNLAAGLRRNPQSKRLWQLKLWRCLDEYRYGDFFEACERFEADTQGQSSLPLAYRAIGFARVQQYSAAMVAFEQALSREAHEVWIRANRASCLVEMKCYEQALAALETTVVDTDFEQALCLKVEAQGLVGLKRYGEAIAINEQLLAKRPSDDEYSVRILVQRGDALRQQGDLQAALASYDQALARSPDDVWALSHRGEMLVQLGQVQAGLNALDHCVLLKPEHPQGWKKQGDSLRKLGRYPRALESYARSLSIQPDIEILCDQAICFLGLEDTDSAAQTLQKAKDLHEPTTMRTVAEKPELAAFAQEHFAQLSND